MFRNGESSEGVEIVAGRFDEVYFSYTYVGKPYSSHLDSSKWPRDDMFVQVPHYWFCTVIYV